MSEGVRRTARVILVDEHDRVLLFLTHWPEHVGLPPRWITPGGGIDPGESEVDAAARELFEETGRRVEAAAFGAPVHTEEFAVPTPEGGVYAGHMTFFLLRTTAFEPSSEHWMPEEFHDMLAHRWWTIDELEATDEPVQPADLAARTRILLARER